MAHRQAGGRTLMVQRQFKRAGIPRIYRSSGTTSVKRLERINQMLTDLAESDDPASQKILEQVASGQKSFLEALSTYQRRGVEGLKALANDAPIDARAFAQWLGEHNVKETTRKTYLANYRSLMRFARTADRMKDLPTIMDRYRQNCVKNNRNQRAWELGLAVSKGWVRSVLGAGSPVYEKLGQLTPPTSNATKSKERHYFSPRDVQNVMQKLPDAIAQMVWTMALHGMGPKEMMQDGCRVENTALRILGEKTKHRNRLVPLIHFPSPVVLRDYKALYRLITRASNGEMRPYDLRRCYPRWLYEAGVSANRIQMYQGHSEQTQTDSYAFYDTRPFLTKDADALRTWVANQLEAAPAAPKGDRIVFRERLRRATRPLAKSRRPMSQQEQEEYA